MCAGYDITNYFRSKATAKKSRKCRLRRTASAGISRERFKRGSPNFTLLSGTTGPRHRPDLTSPLTSGRLQNSIKYCTKVMRQRGRPKSQIFRPLFNSDSPHVARTSVPTQSMAIPDMTPPAISDRHLPKFEQEAHHQVD